MEISAVNEYEELRDHVLDAFNSRLSLGVQQVISALETGDEQTLDNHPQCHQLIREFVDFIGLHCVKIPDAAIALHALVLERLTTQKPDLADKHESIAMRIVAIVTAEAYGWERDQNLYKARLREAQAVGSQVEVGFTPLQTTDFQDTVHFILGGGSYEADEYIVSQ